MHLARQEGGYSPWWLVFGGLVLALGGVTFAVLDAVGIYEVVRNSLIFAPITAGLILVVVGLVLVLRKKRVD